MTEFIQEIDPTVLTDAVTHASEAIFFTDIHGDITYINPAFTVMTGYSKDEAIGFNPRILKSGEHGPSFYGVMWHNLVQGRQWKGRVRNRRKDGTVFVADSTITPVFSTENILRGYLCIAMDVTLELQLQERQATRQKLETIGTLAGGVAHDFNNVMTAILGYTQLLGMSVSELSAHMPAPHEHAGIQDSAREYIDGIIKATQRAKDLADRILTFSRGKTVGREATNLSTVVSDSVRLLRATVPSAITITTDIAKDIPRILANPTQITQVVINLGINAALAMENRDNGHIEITLASAAEAVTLTITDNGVGMSPEVINRLYEPFFTTRPESGGTGLGLPVVLGIVTEYGGTIDIASEVGRGSRFTITFPAIADDPSVSATAEEENIDYAVCRQIGKGERIAFVDDEEDICRAIAAVLTHCGFHVTAYSTPTDFLADFRENPDSVELLISDISMPGMWGDDLLCRVREVRPLMPVIGATGYTGRHRDGGSSSGGFSAVITKPYDIKRLLEAISRAMEESR